MTERIDYAQEITRRYGYVRRARGCYLYTARGRRILDMYLEGGRAILGWRGGRSQLTLKNLLDRGLGGTFETPELKQLEKAIRALAPQHSVIRWYQNEDKTRNACARYLDLWIDDLPLVENEVIRNRLLLLQHDAILQANGICIWRPWIEDAWYHIDEESRNSLQELNWCSPEITVIPIPFPSAGEYFAVAFSVDKGEKIAPSDPIPAAVAGAMARACNDLHAEIPKRWERDWQQYDRIIGGYWQRRGPYLIPEIPKEHYGDFFLHCLDRGILISPVFSAPSIIPVGADSTALNPLAK
ncbi:MAG: hypothetical protein LBR47_01610 [Spirochaetaceae bacterium]|jgi:hypothetical protein|nr:hypothetical protein [Spirochaetaceae bacterium]